MLAITLLLVWPVSTPFPDPCRGIDAEDLRLECAFILADKEWERAGALLERARAAVMQTEPNYGFDVPSELEENQVEWEDYADGACAAGAHRRGPSESFEGYYAFFQCRRQMNFERSTHLWREYLADSAEVQPMPILDYSLPPAPPRPVPTFSP